MCHSHFLPCIALSPVRSAGIGTATWRGKTFSQIARQNEQIRQISFLQSRKMLSNSILDQIWEFNRKNESIFQMIETRKFTLSDRKKGTSSSCLRQSLCHQVEYCCCLLYVDHLCSGFSGNSAGKSVQYKGAASEVAISKELCCSNLACGKKLFFHIFRAGIPSFTH